MNTSLSTPTLSQLIQRKPIDVSRLVVKTLREKGVKEILAYVGKRLKGLDEVVLDILSGLAVGRHIWIVGPVGCGKTTLAETIAEVLNLDNPPYIEVACHSHMTATELTGDIDIAVALQAGLDHPLAYIPGPLVLAHGRILILDEINRLSPYSQAALLQALQEHYVVIRGFRIRSDFLMIATGNPSEYSGTYDLSEALADRMKRVEITIPERDLLKEIILWKAAIFIKDIDLDIDEKIAEVLATLAHLINKDSKIESEPSIRSCIYALATAASKAWIKGSEEISIEDLRKEVIQNMLPLIQGEFSSDEEKVKYLDKKFREALLIVSEMR